MVSPNVFRKGDATSCLVVDKKWEDIINKPDFFDELVDRIVDMVKGAEKIGQLTKFTTHQQLKDAINEILLTPLRNDWGGGETSGTRETGSVLADAFWDEILQTEEKWERFKDAVAKAYEMKLQIDDRQPLTDKDTWTSTKDNFNNTVVKPLLGINEDE